MRYSACVLCNTSMGLAVFRLYTIIIVFLTVQGLCLKETCSLAIPLWPSLTHLVMISLVVDFSICYAINVSIYPSLFSDSMVAHTIHTFETGGLLFAFPAFQTKS